GFDCRRRHWTEAGKETARGVENLERGRFVRDLWLRDCGSWFAGGDARDTEAQATRLAVALQRFRDASAVIADKPARLSKIKSRHDITRARSKLTRIRRRLNIAKPPRKCTLRGLKQSVRNIGRPRTAAAPLAALVGRQPSRQKCISPRRADGATISYE